MRIYCDKRKVMFYKKQEELSVYPEQRRETGRAPVFLSIRGQLAALFIVVLVVLLMMALVTVNLGKVALIKTEASNGSDAGALVGGSAMARLFNDIARLNYKIERSYWSFRRNVKIRFFLDRRVGRKKYPSFLKRILTLKCMRNQYKFIRHEPSPHDVFWVNSDFCASVT